MRLVVGLILSLILVSGCATVDYYHPVEATKPDVPGIYHEVQRGETLWYISKIYAVDLEKIIGANRLPDASKVEVGQLIFVPEIREKDQSKIPAKNIKLEGFIWPVKGVVVSYFGSMRNMAKNSGIDIETRKGAAVLASRSGKVAFVSDGMKGYGKTIIIDHMDGFETVYSHNAENLAAAGQEIKQGTVIAKAGSTGRVDKPTLHFEIRKKHKPENPFYYLP